MVPPVPLMILHAPVPTIGVLAASVTVVIPQVVEPVWSVPAAATVGAALLVSVTSLNELQVPLTIVHRNTAEVPTGTPVIIDMAEFTLVTVAVPL